MTKANGQMSKEIYLAGGCFWGAEHFLKQIEGVEATEVGYANGHTDRPTYEEVVSVSAMLVSMRQKKYRSSFYS